MRPSEESGFGLSVMIRETVQSGMHCVKPWILVLPGRDPAPSTQMLESKRIAAERILGTERKMPGAERKMPGAERKIPGAEGKMFPLPKIARLKMYRGRLTFYP
jgi:hypothetical protein